MTGQDNVGKHSSVEIKVNFYYYVVLNILHAITDSTVLTFIDLHDLQWKHDKLFLGQNLLPNFSGQVSKKTKVTNKNLVDDTSLAWAPTKTTLTKHMLRRPLLISDLVITLLYHRLESNTAKNRPQITLFYQLFSPITFCRHSRTPPAARV